MTDKLATNRISSLNISSGWLNGFLGMLIFSASLPATRIAVMDFNPIFLTSVRATIAGLLGFALLMIFNEKRPGREDFLPLFIVAIGVVVGFPLFTALALQHITASYSIVFIGILPLVTALFGVLLAGERPTVSFWVFSCVGSMLVAGFALTRGIDFSLFGNLYMLAAIIVCGMGYAQGAVLSRKFGGWQVISWALILSLPAMASISVFTRPETLLNISPGAWIGLFYVSVFSMLVGFIFWYRGLAQGGIAAVGQLQLLQPFFGFFLAAILLRESIGLDTMIVTIAVILCVIGAKHFNWD